MLLLAAETFLYWGLSQSLVAQSERLLATKTDIVRFLLNDPAKINELRNEIEHEAGEGHAAKYYLRVVGADGQIAVETPGMSEILPIGIFPTVPAGTEVSSPMVIHRAPAQSDFTLMAARATPPGHRPRTLHIAQNISINRTILAGARRRLLIVFFAGVAFAAVAGMIVARLSLRPLGEIAQTAHGITANRLEQRLNTSTWPKELRVVAMAFDTMLDRLQDAFSRLTRFSADLAHELRTPINNVRGEAEVALARARTNEEYQHIIASNLEEFERLTRLIERLLFIARADNPQTAIERIRVSIRRELDAVSDFYDALAAERRVTVTCEGEAEISGDPILLRRVIGNLLANALNHTSAGGKITLAAAALADGTAEIRIADTGRGIAAEHLPKVFDRFYQAENTRGIPAKGAGLGLAIVRSIMLLHGGEASIESAVGKGTIVTLRFPPAT